MEPREASRHFDTYQRASQRVYSWMTGALSLSFVEAALHSGVLDLLQHPCTMQDIARHLQCDEAWAGQLCQALYALHVIDRQEDTSGLSADFACLLAPDTPLSLADTLGIYAALRRTTERLFDPPQPYAQLPASEQLRIAKGKWGAPVSPLARYAWQHVGLQMPELLAIWSTQSKHLEVGCGVGRDLLCLAAVYLHLQVTGVDTNAEALAHVAHEAHALGLAERVTLQHADIRTLTYAEEFHTVFWSQIFFPQATRQATLQVVHRALRPGGYLLVPLQPALPPDVERWRESTVPLPLFLQLLYRSWDLNPLTAVAIRQEAAAAGFVFMREASAPYHMLMLLQKP